MSDASSTPELTKDQQISLLTRSLDTRGRALKVAFAVSGLLVVALLVMVQITGGLRGDLSKGREERRSYQAETRYLICFLAEDDEKLAEPEIAAAVEDLCRGYEDLDRAFDTENNRDEDGRLPEPR